MRCRNKLSKHDFYQIPGRILIFSAATLGSCHKTSSFQARKVNNEVDTLHLAVLAALPCTNEYCFPGRRGTGHVVNVKATWRRLLDTARLTGWRIHDLRHAYASYAACSGKSLPVIGAILGHTQAATTARYAHLADTE